MICCRLRNDPSRSVRRPVVFKEDSVFTASRHQRATLMAEVLAVAFMGCIAATANNTGLSLLFFPELAALSHDVLTRPRGKWASQPIRMIVTPTLTATAGLIVTRGGASQLRSPQPERVGNYRNRAETHGSGGDHRVAVVTGAGTGLHWLTSVRVTGFLPLKIKDSCISILTFFGITA
jgi:hypothetical protein